MNIEEGPFETLDIVDIAMNKDNNEFRKIRTNSANKDNIIIQKIISICNCQALCQWKPRMASKVIHRRRKNLTFRLPGSIKIYGKRASPNLKLIVNLIKASQLLIMI